MPQMTRSRDQQSSEDDSQNRENKEFSVPPSSSLARDASTHQWGVDRMETIFLEGI